MTGFGGEYFSILLGLRFHFDDVVEAGLCHFGRLLDSQLHTFGGAARTFDGSLHKRHSVF